MARWLAFWIALLAVPSAADEGLPDHAALKTEIVVISPARLVPSVMVVADTEAFGWLNYAARDAAISFPVEITRRMACKGPSPFRVDGPRLVAEPVTTGNFATLCKLQPGVYEYRVEIAGRSDPLLGKLVVPEAEAPLPPAE
ncbi:MAG: hypothetical protein AAF430_06730 [Myxococcota bacterium]